MIKKWTVSWQEKALKQLAKLDKPVQIKIMSFLEKKVCRLENPRHLGHQLTGTLSHFWRFRVGDYRLLCSVKDHDVTIVVVHVGHRKDIYH